MALFRFLIELVSAQRMINARFIRPSARQALLLCMLAMAGIAQALAATNLSPSPATDHVATRMLLMAEPYADVSAGSMAAQPPSAWSQLHNPVLNFSFDDQAYWLRIEISNPLLTPYSLVADLGQPLQDYVDAWLFDADNQLLTSWSTGDRRPDQARPLPYRAFAFPMTVPPQSELTLLIRLDTHDGLYDAIPVSLFSYIDFYKYQQMENFWFGVYYGAIIILLLYNLVVGLALKSGNFLLYTLYLASFLLWNLAFRGYFSYLSLPGGTWWHNEAVAVFSVAIFYSLTAFTIRFLELARQTPRLRLALLASCVVMLYPLWLALRGHYSPMFAIFIPMAILNLVLILVVAIFLSWRGQRSARIFLLAWGLLIVSAFAYYGRVYGVLPSTWLTENALNIGSLIEMLVLALALADRIKQAELARLEDKNYLIRRERELNEVLQQRVDEKTAELREINKKLATESVTDALTGLLNRRSFYPRLEDEIRRASRAGHALAFVILDIDHFKALNDRRGHPEGDRILREAGNLLRSHWQRATDAIYRLGGEEFGVILTPVDRDELISRIRELQDRFRTDIPTGDDPDASNNEPLTLSAGVVLVNPDDRLDASTIYQLADQALYESKSGGRNTLRLIRPGGEPELA